MDLTGEPWLWLLGAIAALLGLGWGLKRRAPHHAKPADVKRQLRIQQLRDIAAEKRATAAREARDHAERAAMLDERVEQVRQAEDRPGEAARVLDDILGTPPGQRRR